MGILKGKPKPAAKKREDMTPIEQEKYDAAKGAFSGPFGTLNPKAWGDVAQKFKDIDDKYNNMPTTTDLADATAQNRGEWERTKRMMGGSYKRSFVTRQGATNTLGSASVKTLMGR